MAKQSETKQTQVMDERLYISTYPVLRNATHLPLLMMWHIIQLSSILYHFPCHHITEYEYLYESTKYGPGQKLRPEK